MIIQNITKIKSQFWGQTVGQNLVCKIIKRHRKNIRNVQKQSLHMQEIFFFN